MSDTNSRTHIKDNKAFVFFVSKVHKIASATYLITDLFDVREPLKWSLRENVLEMVSSVASMLASNASSMRTLNDVKKTIEEVLFLIETAGRARLISPMNRDVMFREIQAFAQELDTHVAESGLVDMRTIEGVFEEKTLAPILPQAPRIEDMYKRHSIGQANQRAIRPASLASRSHKTPQKQPADIQEKGQTQTGANGKERADRIIDILNKKGAVTIKDIAAAIPDVSEKTIQRDLSDMILSGAVQKKGERRWTVYFL